MEQDERATPYYEFKSSRRSNDRDVRNIKGKKLVLVFGEETKGLPKTILGKADKILEIPMRGKKESLNVSVAAGVVIYHLAVQS